MHAWKPHGFVVENAEPACISNRWRRVERRRWRGVTQARI